MSNNIQNTTEEEEEEEEDEERTKNSQTKTLEAIIKEDESIVTAFGDYQIGELIAVGGSAKVFKGLNMKNGQFVAIKEIQLKNESFIDEELPKILSEINLLRELSHPNIVRYIDYHMKEKICLHIVLEFIENGSLQQTVRKFGSLPEILVGKYSLQVLKGLEYLHDKDIIHRDIKGANILITKQGYCKLADFGVATQIDRAEMDTVGTPYWMAPELFENSPATKASDVWSFGITVLELLTGNPPYFDKKPVQAVFEIIDNLSPPIPSGLPEDLVDFLEGCFKRDPELRPTVKDLISHPWILRNNNDTKIFFKEFEDVTHSLICNSNNSEPLNKLKKIAENNPEELLEKLQEKPPGDIVYSDDIDVLRKQLAEKYAENELLISIACAFQREVEQKDRLKQLLLKNINILEDNFAKSDTKLSRKIYGDNLKLERFTDSTKGVLLVKKGERKSYKWELATVLKKGTSLQFSPPTHLKITQVTLREGKGSCRVLVSYFDIAQNDDVTVPFASVSTANPNHKTNLVLEEGQDVTLSVDADCTISLVGFYIIEEDDEDFQLEGDEDDEDLMDSFITEGDGEIDEEDDAEEEADVKMEEAPKAKKDYVVALKDKSTPAAVQQKAAQPQKKVQPAKVEEKKQPQAKKEVAKEQPQAKNKFTLSGGVEVEVLKQGNGNTASRGKRVTVKYTGRLAKNQKVFDSGSIPFKLGAGEVIKGWDLGIDGMKIGEKRKLTIPPALAYGNKGAGRDIPGGSTLIFDVELLKC